MTQKSWRKDMTDTGDRIWALDTLNEIEVNLKGIAEIALVLHEHNSNVKNSFAIISDLSYADAERLHKAAEILNKNP